jgi:branched-chain amino acid transport system permease protein
MTTFIDYLLGGFSSGAVIALFALALVLVWRSTRIVNFAQVGQAMFTTFIALVVQQTTGSWILGLLAGLVAGGILGLIVYALVLRPVQRLDTSGSIIATFGVLISLQALAAMIWGGEPQSFPPPVANNGLEIGGRIWPISWYDVLVYAVTALGLSMRASAFNPEVAKLSGIRVNRMLAFGWALAGVVGAVAGVLIAPTASLSPNSFDILLIFAFTAAVVGGLDSLIGAVAFGVGTGLVLALVTGYGEAGDAPIVVLILLAITLVVRPGGVFGRGKSRAV